MNYILPQFLHSLALSAVARIVSKKFVNMAELLAENLTPLATLKKANPLSELVTGTRRKLRPVPDLTSWAACFAAYTIIQCSRHRDEATMMLGYMRLILQEASAFPAERWREYDVRFLRLPRRSPVWTGLARTARYFRVRS